jgi:hypothetical protein
MSETNERSVASTGSVDKPVAWATLFCGSPLVVSRFKQLCDDEAHYQGDVATVIPLYRSPTLTDAEREALERAIETLDGWQKTGGYHSAIEDDADALRGLLSRLGDCPTPDNEADRDSGTTGSV